MPLTSDLTLNYAPFAEQIGERQRAFNDRLTQMTRDCPKWWEIGAPAYRKLREEGKTPFPGRTVLEAGRDVEVPSRDADRTVPCRVFVPPDGKKPVGLFMHIHGGGWVLQNQLDYDVFCTRLAADSDVVVVTVGYRLAPEHPFPAAPHDCYDVAVWLAANSVEKFGAPLRAVGGESAGGHLSLLTSLHLLKLPTPYLGVRTLLLHYGAYDISELPAAAHFDLDLILPRDITEHFKRAFVPGADADPALLKRADLSPFYADLRKLPQRPACLFTCGTLDPLIDDTLMMAVRWMAAGGEAVVKIMPGQPHGYATFNPDISPATAENFANVAEFLSDKLR